MNGLAWAQRGSLIDTMARLLELVGFVGIDGDPPARRVTRIDIMTDSHMVIEVSESDGRKNSFNIRVTQSKG